MDFPNLSQRPLTISVEYVDSSLRQTFEGGYESRRPKYTRKKRKFTLTYEVMSITDRNTLKSFYESVQCSSSFNWTDKESNTFVVYFDSPLKFVDNLNVWNVIDPIVLVEV